MIIFQSWKIEVIDFNSQFRSLTALFQFFYTEPFKKTFMLQNQKTIFGLEFRCDVFQFKV